MFFKIFFSQHKIPEIKIVSSCPFLTFVTLIRTIWSKVSYIQVRTPKDPRDSLFYRSYVLGSPHIQSFLGKLALLFIGSHWAKTIWGGGGQHFPLCFFLASPISCLFSLPHSLLLSYPSTYN